MTMYDMTRVTANGYFDAEDSEQARFEKRKALNAQRTEDYKNGVGIFAHSEIIATVYSLFWRTGFSESEQRDRRSHKKPGNFLL